MSEPGSFFIGNLENKEMLVTFVKKCSGIMQYIGKDEIVIKYGTIKWLSSFGVEQDRHCIKVDLKQKAEYSAFDNDDLKYIINEIIKNGGSFIVSD